MNRALLAKEVREGLWKFVLGTLFLLLTAFAVTFLYDFIREIALGLPTEQLERYLPQLALLEDHSLYLWSQWNGKNLYQIGIILAIILGMSPIAGEVSGQTIGFLLSRPLSRQRIFYHKAAAGMLLLGLAVFISTAVLMVAGHYVLGPIATGRLLATTLITLLGLLVVYSFSLLMSTLMNEPIKAGVAAGVIVVLAAVPGWFAATRSLSLFTHLHGGAYFMTGVFPLVPVLVMLVLLISFLAAGAFYFQQKEY